MYLHCSEVLSVEDTSAYPVFSKTCKVSGFFIAKLSFTTIKDYIMGMGLLANSASSAVTDMGAV